MKHYTAPVSYTHLDVYKRQIPVLFNIDIAAKFQRVTAHIKIKITIDCLLYTSRCV